MNDRNFAYTATGTSAAPTVSVNDAATAPQGEAWRQQYGQARVLITGGLGLIGSSLARRLAGFGVPITLLDCLNPASGGNSFNIDALNGAAQVVVGDVRDEPLLRDLIGQCGVVFNLAGQTSHMDSMSAPHVDLEINSRAQLSLMELCRTVNPHVRVVFASTRQVYGRPQYLPVDEKHPVKPVDVNGINKISGESYHLLYQEVYGIKTTVLRLTNTYGPGMRIKDARQMFLGIWIRRLLDGQPFEVWGGEQRRDFTFVDDAAAAFVAAALSPDAVGQILNVGGDQSISLTDLAQLLVRANGGGEFSVRQFPADRKAIDIGDFVSDDSRLRRMTAWQPVVSLVEGLRHTLQFYRAHQSHYL